MSASSRVQIGALARRSVLRTLRQPSSIVPALVFPLILLAVNSGGLKAVTELPGFPTSNYLDFFIAFTFLQGAAFATTNAGTDLARDIQSGFLNRISLTPLRRSSILAGHLAGAAAMGLVQSVVYLAVGLAAGVTVASGVPGMLVLLCLATLVAVGFGAAGAMLALRTGTGEAVQGMFPFIFGLLFLSTMFLPLDLIEAGWFRAIATVNPVSYMIDGLRSLVITGWDAEALALGFGVAAVVAALALAGAAAALRTRLTRT